MSILHGLCNELFLGIELMNSVHPMPPTHYESDLYDGATTVDAKLLNMTNTYWCRQEVHLATTTTQAGTITMQL